MRRHRRLVDHRRRNSHSHKLLRQCDRNNSRCINQRSRHDSGSSRKRISERPRGVGVHSCARNWIYDAIRYRQQRPMIIGILCFDISPYRTWVATKWKIRIRQKSYRTGTIEADKQNGVCPKHRFTSDCHHSLNAIVVARALNLDFGIMCQRWVWSLFK